MSLSHSVDSFPTRAQTGSVVVKDTPAGDIRMARQRVYTVSGGDVEYQKLTAHRTASLDSASTESLGSDMSDGGSTLNRRTSRSLRRPKTRLSVNEASLSSGLDAIPAPVSAPKSVDRFDFLKRTFSLPLQNGASKSQSTSTLSTFSQPAPIEPLENQVPDHAESDNPDMSATHTEENYDEPETSLQKPTTTTKRWVSTTDLTSTGSEKAKGGLWGAVRGWAEKAPGLSVLAEVATALEEESNILFDQLVGVQKPHRRQNYDRATLQTWTLAKLQAHIHELNTQLVPVQSELVSLTGEREDYRARNREAKAMAKQLKENITKWAQTQMDQQALQQHTVASAI